MQQTNSNSPWLFDCSVAARELEICDVIKASKLACITNQNLAAPDCAVGAIAGAVHNQADNRSADFMFRTSCNHVSMVVLNFNNLLATFSAELRRVVSRVQVNCHT